MKKNGDDTREEEGIAAENKHIREEDGWFGLKLGAQYLRS